MMHSSKTFYSILFITFISALFFELDAGLYFYKGNLFYSLGNALAYSIWTILITGIIVIILRIFGKVKMKTILLIANSIGILVLLFFIYITINKLL